jgi:hypothetical protein
MRSFSVAGLAAFCLALVLALPTVAAAESAQPTHKSKKWAAENNEELLPVRPKNFNAMQPPSMPDVETMEAQRDAQQSSNVSAMYVAELSAYFAQLSRLIQWVIFIAVAGLFFLLLILNYLRRNALAMEKTAKIAQARTEIAEQKLAILEGNAQKQIRAFIFVNRMKGEWMDNRSGRYVVDVEFKNFGSTPAYGLTGWLTVFTGDSTQEREAASLPYTSEMVERILPPGETFFQGTSTHQPISSERTAIAAGKRAVFIHVEIRYKDIFGVERYSRYRGKCTGEQSLGAGTFELCAGGSEAD